MVYAATSCQDNLAACVPSVLQAAPPIEGLDRDCAELMKAHHDNHIKAMEKASRTSAPIEYPDCGHLCWKIPHWSHLSRDPNHRAVLSPCFHSSQYGYNMRLRMNFGPPQDKLEVLVVEGQDDDRLHFPFRGKVDIGVLSFGQSDGVYESLVQCDATRCFSGRYGGKVAMSLDLPHLSDSDFLFGDDVYINCIVQAEGP